jgi:hypothetical protein
MTAARDLTRTIRQRISEGAPLDALAQELAQQQTQIDELAEQLRVLRAQRALRDVLLPQAQVSYKGLSVARIEAGMPLDTRRGFYSLEYDEHGQPFRGPDRPPVSTLTCTWTARLPCDSAWCWRLAWARR